MAPSSTGGLIFISCGQRTAQEKQLGEDVCSIVRVFTPHQPYFAQNQSSLDALTKDILSSLDSAVGLIAIMHPRGTVGFDDGTRQARASVWIEQEIAIAAFITQILGRPLRIAPYIHADIPREGMREQLKLNPVSFRDDNEVRAHLADLLPTWRELPSSLKVPVELRVRVALTQGLVSNYIFEFSSDEDEDIFIQEIRLESGGYELTDPLTPDSPDLWKLRAHDSLTAGKSITHQRNPAVGLANIADLNQNKGLFLKTEMEVVLRCRVAREIREVRKKLFVKVSRINNEISQLV